MSEREFLHSPVVIVPWVVHAMPRISPTLAVVGPVNLSPSVSGASDLPGQFVAGMEVSGTIPLEPSTGNLASAGINEFRSQGPEAAGPIMSVASFSTGGLGEGAVPPIVVVATPIMEATGRATVSDPVNWGSDPPPSMPGTNSGGAVSGEASGVAGAGEVDVASVSVARHVQFDSTLNSAHSSMSVLIPVGPTTKAIGVSLHPLAAGDAGDVPIVDEMILEDRYGTPIAELGPFNGPMATPPIRAFTVALENAPVGGSLLVQVSLPMINSPGTGAQSTSSQGAGSSLPFMMDIQRQEATGSMTSDVGSMILGPLPGLVRSGIGTLTTTAPTGQGGGNAPGSADSSNPDTESGSQTVIVDQGNLIPPTEDPSDSGEDRDGSLGVGTGPLVSRSSSPLGPILATLLADPAPPVDRHERALSQTIEESGSDEDALASIRSRDPARFRGSTSESPSGTTTDGLSDGIRLASAGVGAFPLKVTGARDGAQGTDLESILVTLPGSWEEMQTLAAGPANPREMGAISMTGASADDSTRTDRMAPTFLTVMCGLALGLGLTARPLLPDLLALVPPRFTRSRRPVPGRELPPE